jgi:hypothetical protein
MPSIVVTYKECTDYPSVIRSCLKRNSAYRALDLWYEHFFSNFAFVFSLFKDGWKTEVGKSISNSDKQFTGICPLSSKGDSMLKMYIQ